MRQFLFSLILFVSTLSALSQNCINYNLAFTSNVPAGGTTCIVWNAYIGDTFYTNGVAQFSNDVTAYTDTVCLPDTCNIHFILDPCQWPAAGTFQANVSVNQTPLVLMNYSDANGLFSFDVCYQHPCPNQIVSYALGNSLMNLILDGGSNAEVAWYFNGNLIGNGYNIVYPFPVPGVYPVVAVVTTAGCPQPYEIPAQIIVPFAGNSPCPQSINLTQVSCNTYTFSLENASTGQVYWDFGDGVLLDGVTTVTHTFETNGNFTVAVTYYPGFDNLCVGQYVLNTPVVVACLEPCNASFEAIETTTPGVFEFVNTSIYTGDATFVWNYGNGVVSDSTNGYQAFSSNGTYQVCLQLNAANGCSTLTCVPVEVTTMNQGCNANLITITVEGSYAAVNVQDELSLILSSNGIEFQVVNVSLGDFLSSYTFEVCLPDGCYSVSCISQNPLYAEYVNFMAIQNGIENSTVVGQAILPNDIQQVAMEFGLNTNCETEVEEIQQEDLRIYPIPADNELTFQLASAKTANLQLLDLTGRVVMAERMDASGQLKLNISQLPKGIYLAKVQTGKEVLTRKVEVK